MFSRAIGGIAKNALLKPGAFETLNKITGAVTAIAPIPTAADAPLPSTAVPDIRPPAPTPEDERNNIPENLHNSLDAGASNDLVMPTLVGLSDFSTSES